MKNKNSIQKFIFTPVLIIVTLAAFFFAFKQKDANPLLTVHVQPKPAGLSVSFPEERKNKLILDQKLDWGVGGASGFVLVSRPTFSAAGNLFFSSVYLNNPVPDTAFTITLRRLNPDKDLGSQTVIIRNSSENVINTIFKSKAPSGTWYPGEYEITVSSSTGETLTTPLSLTSF